MKIYTYIFSFIFFFALQTTISGQAGKLIYWFDKDMNIVPKDSAKYLGITEKENGKVKFTTYHKHSGTMIMKGYFTDTTLSAKDGLFTYYDSLGFAASEGNYKNDMEEGNWVFWRDAATDTAFYEKGVQQYKITVSYHEENGMLASRTYQDYKAMTREVQKWDSSGVLESKASWKGTDGEIHSFYPNGKIKKIERRASGEKTSFVYFNEKGEDITKKVEKENKEDEGILQINNPFPSGPDKPNYPGGREEFFDFIKRNFNLPERGNSSRTVGSSVTMRISFKLDKMGNAKDINVEGVIVYTQMEMVKVIQRMPRWKMNGLQSYGPITVFFTVSMIY